MAFNHAHAHERPIVGAVATVGVDERISFIRKTYAHLAGAVGLFILLEYILINTEMGLRWAVWSMSNWWLVLILFMGSGWVAQKWARSDTSRTIQYLGLALVVVSWAFVFVPMMAYAVYFSSPSVLPSAALTTLVVFGGLTATVFITRKDFSFLGGILSIGFFAALALIFAGMLFGFNLGLWFAVAMVGLAAGSVLYSTSQVLGHYRPTQWVAASLELFGALALLFYYVLWIFISLDD